MWHILPLYFLALVIGEIKAQNGGDHSGALEPGRKWGQVMARPMPSIPPGGYVPWREPAPGGRGNRSLGKNGWSIYRILRIDGRPQMLI